YAPAAERAKAVSRVAEHAHEVLAAGRANLEPALPRSFLETALIQVTGQIAFVKKDVPAALGAVPGLDKLAAELAGWRDFLGSRKAAATDEFALGSAQFLTMLAEQEGVEIDLETLERAGRADLERNLAALAEVARQIDPKATVAEVMHRLHDEK